MRQGPPVTSVQPRATRSWAQRLLTLLFFLSPALAHSISSTNPCTLWVHAGSAAAIEGGAAAAELLVEAVRLGTGITACLAPSPAICAAVRDAPACLTATQRLLDSRPGLVLAAAETAGSHCLNLAGEAFPPMHRTCYRLNASADSISEITELSDPKIIQKYSLTLEELRGLLTENVTRIKEKMCTASMPSSCSGKPCLDVFTDTEGEAHVLHNALMDMGVCARLVPLGRRLLSSISYLATRRPVIACVWTTNPLSSLQVVPLSSPPCFGKDCPFNGYRFLKFSSYATIDLNPDLSDIFNKFRFNVEEFQNLINLSINKDPKEAALAWLEMHPKPVWLKKTYQEKKSYWVGVLIPSTGGQQRQAYEGAPLATAGSLIVVYNSTLGTSDIKFDVQNQNDKCSASSAVDFILSTLLRRRSIASMSAVVGPACGAALNQVAHMADALGLPLLAYTPQPTLADAPLLLLAAGEQRRPTVALSELLAAQHWRRVALLVERSFDASHLDATVVHRLDLSDDSVHNDYDAVRKWAESCVTMRARILVVLSEDARVVRAALCAGWRVGLRPQAGAQWLLPTPTHHRWLHAGPGDIQNCTDEQLAEMAEGYMSVTAEWAWKWETSARENVAVAEWIADWCVLCHRFFPEDEACAASPQPAVALLFDVLQIWHAALSTILRNNEDINLRDRTVSSSLLEWVTSQNYTGLTGKFEWERINGNWVRSSPLVIVQWNNETRRRIALVVDGELQWEEAPLWATKDGVAPDDGEERCTLQSLAEFISLECQETLVVVCGMTVAALAVLLATAAWYSRRRLERQYRSRLAALPLRSIHKPPAPDRWEVPRERLVINRRLGAGAFGAVYGGQALLPETNGWAAVAVKTLKPGAGTDEKLDFLSEAETMKRFNHANIVRLLGVITATEPVCTVMEFMLYGDLKSYLLARRHLVGSSEGEAEVGARRLTALARDAARGLAYLHQQRYVHRDLAARNCLVSARRVLKLADFGMTRLIFEGDYYRFERKGLLPVRWMAPEALEMGMFSGASDVWALGVLLYETVTLGALPHQGLSNRQVLVHVKAGGMLELPLGLRPQLAALLCQCWQLDREARPRASEVAALLADSPRLLQPCLDLPLDSLSFDQENQETRWQPSWGAPTSAGTESSYLSADGATPPSQIIPPSLPLQPPIPSHQAASPQSYQTLKSISPPSPDTEPLLA